MNRTPISFTGILGTLALVIGSSAFAANLAVTIDNIKEFKGSVRVAVCGVTNWLDEDYRNTAGAQALDLTEHPAAEPVTLNFALEPREYGAVVYHDVNANVVFDKNLIGIPKEPYAFGQGFNKFRTPKFEECKFVVGQEGTAVTLTLKG